MGGEKGWRRQLVVGVLGGFRARGISLKGEEEDAR
jgi:hypothetical protein